MAFPQLSDTSVELLRAGESYTFSNLLRVSLERCLLGKNESGRVGPSISSNSELL